MMVHFFPSGAFTDCFELCAFLAGGTGLERILLVNTLPVGVFWPIDGNGIAGSFPSFPSPPSTKLLNSYKLK